MTVLVSHFITRTCKISHTSSTTEPPSSLVQCFPL